MSAQPLRIVMRADASLQIGLGHVKRCLSLASALNAAGCEVCLLSRDLGVDVRALAAAQGVEVELLLRPPTSPPIASDNAHAHWAGVSWSKDAQDSLNAIAGRRVDWFIVDHYAFDARWHRAVGRASGAAIAVIDDLADRPLDASVVIDHNYAVDHRAKYGSCVAPEVRILGGPRFALLSSVYADAMPYVFSERVNSIGIFMGGLDASDRSSVVLQACREHACFAGPIEVATTRGNPNLASLLALSERWPRTVVHTDLPQLAEFFARHDLQIGAGGGATWERCCVGAPTLALVCAKNQRAVISELKALGVIATVEPIDDVSVPTVGHAVRRMIDDPEARRRIASRARLLVDGLGARRVALALCSQRIVLRDARREDAALMYEWRNHVSTRQVSANSAEIEWPAHLSWLERVLRDADRMLQVGTIGSVPVGVIRFDGIRRAEAEVSLYLDPRLHGLGLGRSLLEAGEERVRQCGRDLRCIVATVLDTNVASRRMFEAAGYIRRDDGRLIKELGA